MAFVACCNYCSARFKLDNAELGASKTCPKCGNQFTAFPFDETQARPGVPTDATSEAMTTADEASDEPALDRPPSTSVAMAPTPRQGVHPAVAFGMAAFVLGSFAWLFASIDLLAFLPIPLGILGLLAVGVGWLSDDRSTAGTIWLALGAAASLSIVLVSLLFPTYFSVFTGRAPVPDYSRPFVVSSSAKLQPPRPLTEEYLEASQGALRLHDFQVHVASAGWLPVSLSKGGPQKQLLRLTLQVHNVGVERRIEFESWTIHPARLSNAKGRPVLRAPPPPSKEPDPPTKTSLAPGRFVDDTLYFDTSEPSDFWILELPNSAWGAEGSLKFRINKEFLQQPAFPVKLAPR